MTARFPGKDDEMQPISVDTRAESDMDLVIGVITAVRNIRGEMNISPSTALSVLVQSGASGARETLENYRDMIVFLARLESLDVAGAGEKPRGTATAIVGDAIVSVYLEGVIDFSKEIDRLDKEIAKLEKEIGVLGKKLDNPNFVSKAPEAVVEQVRQQHREHSEKLDQLVQNRDKIKALEVAR